MSVSCILFFTAGTKILSLYANLPRLSAQNPLFWYLSNRQVILLATTFEATTIATILLSTNRALRLGLILWLSTLFLVYRFGLWWIHANTPCSCFGDITTWIGLTPSEADTVSKVVLVYLLGGSLGLLGASVRKPNVS